MIKKLFSKKNSDTNWNGMFYPKSICVIGASNNVNKIGGFIFSQLKEKQDIILYPVNVKFESIQNVRAFVNIKNVKSDIDLAIIAIPSSLVLDAVRDCGKCGVKNVIIITAGFKETGKKGKEREEELKKLIDKYSLNVIGPNCLGILNCEIGLNCSFAKECSRSGDVALISQSGAVIDALIDWSFKADVGFSKIVSLGNMAGIDALDMLKFLGEDKKTKSIIFYMETLEKGEEFGRVLREISKKKPVVIIKPGNSDGAKKAIGSHTGSLAQDNVLVKSLIRENNGIFVESLNELFNILIGLKMKSLPKNKKLVILTNAGGVGVVSTDYACDNGFDVIRFGEDSDDEKKKRKEMFDFLPSEASLNNPIDILGDAKSDRYLNTLNTLDRFNDNEIGSILVLLTPQIMTDCLNVAKSVVDIAERSNKSIFTCFLGSKEIEEAVEFLNKNGIANFTTPSEALIAMRYIRDYNEFDFGVEKHSYEFDEVKIKKVTKKLKGKSGLLDFELTREVMDIFNIALPKKIVLKDISEVLDIELDNKKTYVLKGDSADLIHKKDVGGVLVGVSCNELKDKALQMFDDLSKVSKDFCITVEEEVCGSEVIVGLKSDENLGKFIMFGMGGTYVSIFKDINFACCPLNKKSARRLVESSKVFEILNGFRGTKKIKFSHLYEILIRMSYLQEIFPQIVEVDLNPIICNEFGVHLVDVKLMLK